MAREKQSQDYVFLRNVKVHDTHYSRGDVLAEDRFPPGYLKSCLRMGHVMPKSDYDRQRAEAEKQRRAGREGARHEQEEQAVS